MMMKLGTVSVLEVVKLPMKTPSSETPPWHLVARYTMIPASIYGGFTGSILWVAEVGHLPLLQCKLLIFLLLGFGLVCVVFNFSI
jgi:hypothetical protein